MSITGHLDTNGVVKVEGKVTGSIRAERQVLVAKGGMVDGDILTREAVIGGEVRGAIYADERVEVQATSLINGDITTKRILLQEGGEVNGHVRMEDPKALSRKTEPPAEEIQSDSANVQRGEQTGGQQSGPPQKAEPNEEQETNVNPSWPPPVAQGIHNP
jgi:cytoskeletal protein CcmA (bactofilin family)